jgi:subtilisin family serine protease
MRMKTVWVSMALAAGLVLGGTLTAGVEVAHGADARTWFEQLNRGNGRGGGSGGGDSTTPDDGGGTPALPPYYGWMSPEIVGAWEQGYFGQGTALTAVDDFRSNSRFRGDLGDGRTRKRHGEWVLDQAGMIAPSASLYAHDFSSGRSVSLRSGLNTLNLSYGMMASAGLNVNAIGWSAQESSIIGYARDGRAVVVKAAGNDNVAIGGTNSGGQVDYLNLALVGTQSVLFVGALNGNGTTSSRTSKAWYSNFAGSNTDVQDRFLMVGVRGDLTELYGTSFAAPIVSGYAAVLGSKFTSATPTQIANQLLSTARTDTISGYNRAIHGRGEASIQRALAPVSIQ